MGWFVTSPIRYELWGPECISWAFEHSDPIKVIFTLGQVCVVVSILPLLFGISNS